MAATRSPQEVFGHHAQALGAEDLEEIVANYSDDVIFITPAGVPPRQGRHPPGVHQAPRRAAAGRVGHRDHPLRGRRHAARVGAEGGGNRVDDGIDTFVFRDGLIRVQTLRYTLQPAR
jgi:ketosteroid isomerase-like protein